ncbi:MAG: methionyl-tRNA formyltransferase [Halobacteriovoraceae bacterium]|nr:methionyl-tRNA formyltransferase [Halobacteriovoraceae bacterium]
MLKTVFFGTPDISVPTLKALKNNPQINLLAIVANQSKKAGRGQKIKNPPSVIFAQKNNIPCFQVEKVNSDPELLKFLEDQKPDLFIVFAFSHFLSEKLLGIPSLGAFNIHTSLLPKYRGAAPIQYALLNGDSETGVSIQKMVKEMDAGDIAHSKTVTISPTDNGAILYDKLKDLAPSVSEEFITKLLSGNLQYTKQDSDKISFAPTLTKEDGHLQFINYTAEQIKNRVRAFDPWPGTFCFLEEKRLKVLEVEACNDNLKPGEVSTKFQMLKIGCREGSLRLKSIQLEGKGKSDDISFLNGYRQEIKQLS